MCSPLLVEWRLDTWHEGLKIKWACETPQFNRTRTDLTTVSGYSTSLLLLRWHPWCVWKDGGDFAHPQQHRKFPVDEDHSCFKESDRFTRRSHITMRGASKHSWKHAAIECMLYPTLLEQPGENSGRVEESLCLEHFRREEKEVRKSQLKACYDKKKPPQLKQCRWAIVRYVMTWQEGISRLDRSLHRFRTRVSPISSKLNLPRWCNVSSFVPGIQMVLWHTWRVVPYIKV